MSEGNPRQTSSRGEFTRATRSAAYAAKGPDVSMATANTIIRSADEARARVQTRFAKQGEDRTNKAYGEILQKHGIEPAPMPSWAASDSQARMMAKARTQVASDLSRQVGRIDRAQARMLKTGQVRATRKANWARGLGE